MSIAVTVNTLLSRVNRSSVSSWEENARVNNCKLDRSALWSLKQHTRQVSLARREQSYVRVTSWDRQQLLGCGWPCLAIGRPSQRDILPCRCTGRTHRLGYSHQHINPSLLEPAMQDVMEMRGRRGGKECGFRLRSGIRMWTVGGGCCWNNQQR